MICDRRNFCLFAKIIGQERNWNMKPGELYLIPNMLHILLVDVILVSLCGSMQFWTLKDLSKILASLLTFPIPVTKSYNIFPNKNTWDQKLLKFFISAQVWPVFDKTATQTSVS